jgi:hypothetical protein
MTGLAFISYRRDDTKESAPALNKPAEQGLPTVSRLPQRF